MVEGVVAVVIEVEVVLEGGGDGGWVAFAVCRM
jgi:hypothetical protein